MKKSCALVRDRKEPKQRIEEADLKTPYIAAVCRFADMDLIGKTKFKFAIDSMYGSGRGVLAGIFQDRGVAARRDSPGSKPAFP